MSLLVRQGSPLSTSWLLYDFLWYFYQQYVGFSVSVLTQIISQHIGIAGNEWKAIREDDEEIGEELTVTPIL